MDWGIFLLCVLILLVAVLRGIQSLRQSAGTERGSPPGTGHHVVEANYFSGGGGGGQSGSFTVPRDPQDYARTFIPKDAPK